MAVFGDPAPLSAQALRPIFGDFFQKIGIFFKNPILAAPGGAPEPPSAIIFFIFCEYHSINKSPASCTKPFFFIFEKPYASINVNPDPPCPGFDNFSYENVVHRFWTYGDSLSITPNC